MVIHQFKVTDILLNDLFEGTLSPDTLADLVDHLAGQGFVTEHAQIHIKQGLLFRAQLRGEPVGHPLDVFPHRLDGRLEQPQFLLDIFGGLFWHQVQVGNRVHHNPGANGYTRGSEHTTEADIAGFFTGERQAADGAGGFAVGDYTGQLGRNGNQKGFFTFVEAPGAFPLLNHQHAQHPAVVDNRYTQKGAEPLFTGFRKVTVARMRRGIFKVDGLFPGAHKTHKTLRIGQADLAYGFLVQALGGHQNIAVRRGVEQVYGADFRVHGFLHPRYNDIQRLVQVTGAVHLLY